MDTEITRLISSAIQSTLRAIAAEKSSISCHGHIIRQLESTVICLETALFDQKQCSYHEDDPHCTECDCELPDWDFSNKEFPMCDKCKETVSA